MRDFALRDCMFCNAFAFQFWLCATLPSNFVARFWSCETLLFVFDFLLTLLLFDVGGAQASSDNVALHFCIFGEALHVLWRLCELSLFFCMRSPLCCSKRWCRPDMERPLSSPTNPVWQLRHLSQWISPTSYACSVLNIRNRGHGIMLA